MALSQPIVPLDAATTMVVRDSDEGVEVLMLRRNLASTWAGGIHLFPGGKVDEEDGLIDTGHLSPDRSEEEARRLLDVEAGGLSFFVAAVRECFEEAGVLLAERRGGGALSFSDGSVAARFVEWRRRLNDGALSLAELCLEEDLVLRTDLLVYFSHWITPEGEPRRYDTRFFVAPMPPGQQALHDDVEVIEAGFVSPARALARARAGEIDLWPPTEKNLEALGRFETTEELLAAARSSEVHTVLPLIVEGADGVRILLPGDPGYDDLLGDGERR